MKVDLKKELAGYTARRGELALVDVAASGNPLPKASVDHSRRRPPQRDCDESPLAGFQVLA